MRDWLADNTTTDNIPYNAIIFIITFPYLLTFLISDNMRVASAEERSRCSHLHPVTNQASTILKIKDCPYDHTTR